MLGIDAQAVMKNAQTVEEDDFVIAWIALK